MTKLNLCDLTTTVIKDCSVVDRAQYAQVIRESFALTGERVLGELSDMQVISLWAYALVEAEQLSSLNVRRGMEPIRYPHIWAKRYLFSKVFPKWIECENNALALLNNLESLRDKVSPVVSGNQASQSSQSGYQLPPAIVPSVVSNATPKTKVEVNEGSNSGDIGNADSRRVHTHARTQFSRLPQRRIKGKVTLGKSSQVSNNE